MTPFPVSPRGGKLMLPAPSPMGEVPIAIAKEGGINRKI